MILVVLVYVLMYKISILARLKDMRYLLLLPVGNLKVLISQNLDIPIFRLYLNYAGVHLSNDTTLADKNVMVNPISFLAYV